MKKILIKNLLACILVLTGWGNLEAQKIYMMGDSHVGSKIYPNKIEEVIKAKYPNIQFTYWHKNGLRFSNFSSNPEYYSKISSFKTNILILNLGTNEAYTNRFSSKNFQKNLDSFYTGLIKKMPDIKVVFITPYTNKLKANGTYTVNENNRQASDIIVEFVKSHPNTYVVDINAKAGTKFIDSPKLNRDKVHLTVEGYKMLGQEAGEDILKLDGLWTK